MVNYRLCPPTADLTAPDATALAGACTVTGEGATFGLSGVAGDIGSQGTGAAPGTATFPEVPPGNATLTQQSPPPAGGLAVFCQGNTSQGNTKPYSQAFLAGASVTFEVLPGEQVSCDWYAGLGQESAGNTVSLYKHTCDAVPLAEAGTEWFDQNCRIYTQGADFDFEYPNGTRAYQRTNNQGYTSWSDVGTGAWSITEVIPDGYGDPALACRFVDPPATANVSTDWMYYRATDGYFESRFDEEGLQFECNWYNIPSTEPGTITIHKWQCPDGTAPEPTYVWYSTNCTTPMNDVTFTLDQPGDTDQQSNTGDSIPGVVTFGSLPTGPYEIAESVPDGYAIGKVFCYVAAGQNGLANPPYEERALTDSTLAFTLESGQIVTCQWYNIPAEAGTVTVYKWDCTPGTESGRELEYYQGGLPNQNTGPCETEHLNIPFTLTDGAGDHPKPTQANGTQWSDVVVDTNGRITIKETIPDGYGDPMVYCGTLDEDTQSLVQSTGGTVAVTPASSPFDYQCNWYNIPYQAGTVTIHKWECPQGMEIEQTLSAHQTNCTQAMDNVTFTLTDSKGPRAKMTSGGMVEWTDVAIEPITVSEEIPFGYSTQPYVSCDFDSTNALPLTYSVINGVLTATLNHPGQKIICHWFNQYLGPGDLTIYKWTCPEGYDYTAWGADPKSDCTEATNGVTFVLDQPADVDLQTDTGDSINGAVNFGGLTPGDYVVNEIVPEGIAEVFVLDCVGLYTESVHPIPLSVGPALQIQIAGGDRIECNWYNVPAMDPNYGWMTVTKFTCSTLTYVSDIDCQVFEGGKTFDLQTWNGTTWVPSTSGTTNTAGQLTWTNLAPGTYRVVEQGATACRVSSDPVDSNGNPVVNASAGSTVKVYNCGVAPPAAGKTPTKYPNTGVEPSESSTRVAPGSALLGALGLLGTASVSRRTFLRRSLIAGAALGGGSVAVATGLAGQPIQPIGGPEGTPESTPNGTPAADCPYPATPEATPEDSAGTPVACARGAVPVHIAIPVIGVYAEIEYLEIIGGEMQQPPGADDVAWYKESARLGERGNVLLAGHLNFWGVPPLDYHW